MPEMSASPLISAYVRLEEDFYKLTKCKLNSKGLSSLMIKQLILQSYSPKISVLSTPLANEYACKFGLKNFLELLNYFEDSLYQQSSILTNKVHVRFLKPIDELLRDQGKLQKLINDSKRNISGLNFKNNVSTELFNLNTLEESSIEFARHIQILKSSTSTTSSTTSQPDNNDNILLHNSAYLHTIAKILSSSTISPFETFNHPILQLLVVSAEDTLADAKKLNSDWKYLNYPKWIDIDKILPLFVIVVDSNSPESLQRGLNLQEQLKLQLNIRSIILPLLMPTEENKIDEEKGYEIIHPPLLASLAQQDPNLLKNLKIPTRIKNAIKNLIVDIINKTLVPYMNRRVNILTEEVVNPRKSFTGRLFNVGKRWGSGASSSSSSSLTATQGGGSQGVGYNALENFYYPKSSEFLIRQLADWLFMLKDYKTSYTTYELFILYY
ncbi:hypothetical protein PACTADRAFT_35849 [Pachysolen tannophilus NRRL Y-2460]|uniref:Uncharacterized protein n=1 Tax=Pachysolen tannophilus NRRL Y-2460 TaxID=669874 RepID=A0A1E4TNB6_PACTA|nr:hypothetical protein PACTADRAFT_35849 [Pachysolen tannophilus NRRL Y-2460]